mmetsp:Transcript_26992/g.56642  ORF Transcript_26992/g.56642 Transcript_26992/m.56642 type:complete len:199 (-) Transcript_26992:1746-2342(-)
MVAGFGSKSNQKPQPRPKRSLSKSPIQKMNIAWIPREKRPPRQPKATIESSRSRSYSAINIENNNSPFLCVNHYELSSCSTCSTEESSSSSNDGQIIVSGILEGITSLCLGSSRSRNRCKSPRRAAAAAATAAAESTTEERLLRLGKKDRAVVADQHATIVVHPTTTKISRLDNSKRVFERRKLFFQKNLFRSLSSSA